MPLPHIFFTFVENRMLLPLNHTMKTYQEHIATNGKEVNQQMTHFRWVICAMLFLATTINYMDRQALSLTWKDFIAPEFHWSNADYGNIAAAFSIFYAIA